MTDLLVVVLIADAAQNAVSADYKSVPAGVLLVAANVGWSYALDRLGQAFPAVGRVLHPPPLLLIKDGVMQRKNMREEVVTPEELLSQIRSQGIEDIAVVKRQT